MNVQHRTRGPRNIQPGIDGTGCSGMQTSESAVRQVPDSVRLQSLSIEKDGPVPETFKKKARTDISFGSGRRL